MTCPRCGKEIPEKPAGRCGRQAKYCSRNCQKRHWDAQPVVCKGCGKRRRARYAVMCRVCYRAAVSEKHYERLEMVAKWWNEGVAAAEIARRLGNGPNSRPPIVQELLDLGWIEARRPKVRERRNAA